MRASDVRSGRGRVDFYAAHVIGPARKRYRWVWHRCYPVLFGAGLLFLAAALGVIAAWK